MKLDPNAAAVVQRVHDAGIPPWRSMPPAIGREVYRQRTLLFDGGQVPSGVERDLTVPTADGPIDIRVYGSVDPRPRPVFIYLHGGGWTFGDLDARDDTCRRIARAADCVVVSVAYRLAPEHPYPAPLDDVMASVRWVVAHAEELAGDASRIAIGGDSAGGNLAAGACLRLREEGGPRIAAQILLYPCIQPWFDTLSYHENADGYLLTRADVIWMWQNYLGRSGDSNDRFACPGLATDLRDLPAALIITAGFDPLRDEGEVYGYKLRAAGVPASTQRFPSQIHNFIAMRIEDAATRAIGLIASATRRAWATGGER